ncbi:helix-turn-helix domain-containing protein [Paenibacillus sp. FSL H7-0331]|uniref:helix-turn-helix domain-containing protein n=1 Tax=Paenibacillus sp. FSL H7-0331 TaxID=1920421 RepID=UPI00096FF837|nr:helix-turn-helix transcriptional regulator [Paenibacillus sp. FSL H7-0331]OMF10784.1 hypothetical protein BK127_26665 [Paenibacillus sp. FSL H7-0331]
MSNKNAAIKGIIGKVIKSLRIKKSLSQEDLAFSCDVDRSYISMVERGLHEPSISKIFEICAGLSVKPSQFIRLVELEYENQ